MFHLDRSNDKVISLFLLSCLMSRFSIKHFAFSKNKVFQHLFVVFLAFFNLNVMLTEHFLEIPFGVWVDNPNNNELLLTQNPFSCMSTLASLLAFSFPLFRVSPFASNSRSSISTLLQTLFSYYTAYYNINVYLQLLAKCLWNLCWSSSIRLTNANLNLLFVQIIPLNVNRVGCWPAWYSSSWCCIA